LLRGWSFPRNFVEWPDFDVYYFRHRQWVFGGILFCNLVAVFFSIALGSRFFRSPLGVANLVTYFIPLVALLAVRSRRANIALLLTLLVRYAIIPELAVLGVGLHSELF
jgi:energy-coupling factor transporter transmembrane protein EcfT